MSEYLLLSALLLLGPLLLAEGLLARYELLAFSVGLKAPALCLPAGMPYARGAAADALLRRTWSISTALESAASRTRVMAESW